MNTSKYSVTTLVFKQALGFIYFIGFLILINQFKPLFGQQGLLPVQDFVKQVQFWQAPSLFYFLPTNAFMSACAWLGLIVSIFAILGLTERFSFWVTTLCWFFLWLIYLSFVNVGQVFYGFGWEILLLEAGFLTLFLGSQKYETPPITIWLLRWLLFRLMFGAGLIKIRGDQCWLDLTCMFYHYETQPMPHFLSWYFHQMPGFLHKLAVLTTHFVELIVPFGFFGPSRVRKGAALITAGFQVMLILSGNLSWLNYITIVLCIACLDDSFFKRMGFIRTPMKLLKSKLFFISSVCMLLIVSILSIKPILNFFSSQQLMNSSFNSLHLVNTYGAFGSITPVRNEIVLEGSVDGKEWLEYGFKGKPGFTNKRPPLVSPYHYKLDWQMWFAAMGSYQNNPWILNLITKMLQNDKDVLGLLDVNPFQNKPPQQIRALLYRYTFTEIGQAGWWRRELKGEYLPPLSLKF